MDRLVVNEQEAVLLRLPGELDGALYGFDVAFEAGTEDELRAAVAPFGGLRAFRLATGGTFITLSARSERAKRVTVTVWLRDDLLERPEPRPLAVIERLMAEEAVADGD